MIGIVLLVMAVSILTFVLYVKITGGMLLSIQTGSMRPFLRKGDMTIVHHTQASSLKKGDVVTFFNPNNPRQTITHRIVQTPHTLGGQTFQTKGDANEVADTPIPASRIVGRVEHVVPKAGYVSDFIRTPIGLASIIYVPALVVVGLETQYYKKQQPYILPSRRKLKKS
jgi:signal peptidase